MRKVCKKREGTTLLSKSATQERKSVSQRSKKVYRERGRVVSKKSGNSFSFNWVIASLFVYLGMQVVFGIAAQNFVLPYIVAGHTRFLTEGLLITMGFYIGAFLLGVFSPGRRMLEPVMAAVFAVLIAFSVSHFTPQMGGWFRIDGLGMAAVGSFLAATFSGFGVYSGEKLMGNVGR